MTTSGTYDYTRNRDQILTRALRLCKAIADGETPDSQMMTGAADALNSMIKHWQGTGIHIWRTTECAVFLQADQTRYTLSSSSTDHATESFTQTETTADFASGVTAITVDSITGIGASYYVGVQLDDGSFHWTTANGAPSGSTINLTDATTDSVSDGAVVIAYQTKLVRPLSILSARRFNLESSIDTPISIWDRLEYQDMPNKTASGAPNAVYYGRRGGANTSGYLYVWQPNSSPEYCLKMTVARPVQIFSAAGNTPDIPEEWTNAITWNLADELAAEYSTPDSSYVRIQKKAAQYLSEVNWFEEELAASIQIVPDLRRR
jgi:hypothetical protein